MIITNKLISLFQGLKSIYNGIYNSIFFTYVDNNKILNINTLLMCLLRGKKAKHKIYWKISYAFLWIVTKNFTQPKLNWYSRHVFALQLLTDGSGTKVFSKSSKLKHEGG